MSSVCMVRLKEIILKNEKKNRPKHVELCSEAINY